ncbi:hypothetical protein [Actinoplanes sp. G11-F43]|uniref:hypothetical protein n=1 Tax=Actinoplanes sp. G11-F43 TaxID=3424130 RepID=UPI003D340CEC
MIFRAALLAAATVTALAPVPAQAAKPRPVTSLLGTYDFGRAAVIGQAGENAGVWKSYTVRSGFAGDDLSITYVRATSPSRSERTVYTAAFNEVKDAQAECRKVGADGVARRVWVSYRCRTGIVASYTLLVR